MKKMLCTVALLAASAWAIAAENDRPARPFCISLQGGVLASVNENSFSYLENGKAGGLFTPHGGLALGYDFSQRFGLRLSASYANNAGACNVRQTSGEGFYPYTFSSVNVFADAVWNVGKISSRFSPKLYAGLGGAHTFNFTDSGHPWQQVSKSNTVFGFRGGFIAQYDFNPLFGIFADLCGEAYTDKYNGLEPTREDHDSVSGYAGFPLDLRVLLSIGVLFHF